jgi:hypothetical protein
MYRGGLDLRGDAFLADWVSVRRGAWTGPVYVRDLIELRPVPEHGQPK